MRGNLTAKYFIKAFMHWCNQPVDLRLLGKNAITLLFLLAFLFQTFNKPLIIADYYVNSNSYEANCENKAKPQLQCHGKCQVMKKLAAEEKKDQQNPERRSENRSEVICQASVFDDIKTPCFELLSTTTSCPLNPGTPTDQSFDFFHPPQA